MKKHVMKFVGILALSLMAVGWYCNMNTVHATTASLQDYEEEDEYDDDVPGTKNFDGVIFGFDHPEETPYMSGKMKDGTDIEDHIVVYVNGELLVRGKDYDVDISLYGFGDGPKDVPMHVEVTVDGRGDYNGSSRTRRLGEYSPRVYDVNSQTLTESKKLKEKAPTFVVKHNGIGYDVYRKDNGAAWERVDTVYGNIKPRSARTWTDPNAQKGHIYQYKLKTFTYRVRKSYDETPKKVYGKDQSLGSTFYRYSKLKKKKKAVSWQQNKDADGYQLAYVNDDDLSFIHPEKSLKRINIKNKKKCSYNLSKKIDAGTTYVWVRNYKKMNGKKIYGPWSNRMSLKKSMY